jgi:hypothetical protein
MKQTNLYRLLFLAIIASAILSFGAYCQVKAQTKLKVGDRVEETGRTDGHNKGTVKQIGTGSRKGCYLIVYDDDPLTEAVKGIGFVMSV